MGTLSGVRENDWTKLLGWPGYRVYRHEIDEHGKTLKLWVRRKRGNRKLVCSGYGRKLTEACDIYQREVRDLAGGPGLLPGTILNFGQQNQVTVGAPGLAIFETWVGTRLGRPGNR